jgi:hypothetical protein
MTSGFCGWHFLICSGRKWPCCSSNLSDWRLECYFQFNPKKNGDEIDEVDNHGHLGITFQSTATWKKHIDDMYKKACSRLFWLGQVKHLLDRYSLIRICVAFIRPVLEYGDVVWGNCTNKEIDLLESVQIVAGRIITGLRCNSSRQ